jgi:hypothetical protein
MDRVRAPFQHRLGLLGHAEAQAARRLPGVDRLDKGPGRKDATPISAGGKSIDTFPFFAGVGGVAAAG